MRFFSLPRPPMPVFQLGMASWRLDYLLILLVLLGLAFWLAGSGQESLKCKLYAPAVNYVDKCVSQGGKVLCASQDYVRYMNKTSSLFINVSWQEASN